MGPRNEPTHPVPERASAAHRVLLPADRLLLLLLLLLLEEIAKREIVLRRFGCPLGRGLFGMCIRPRLIAASHVPEMTSAMWRAGVVFARRLGGTRGCGRRRRNWRAQ